MKTLLRILVATIAAIIVLVGSVALILLIFHVEAPKIAAILSFGTWVGVYKLLKPKTIIPPSENYHPDGHLKEKGNIINGKKEGDWDVFDENGKYIKTVFYVDGKERYSKTK